VEVGAAVYYKRLARDKRTILTEEKYHCASDVLGLLITF
jgi:hypothetical protein